MDKMNFFAETSEDDKMRQEDKEFFIQYNHVECGGDKAIIEFIANFRFFCCTRRGIRTEFSNNLQYV